VATAMSFASAENWLVPPRRRGSPACPRPASSAAGAPPRLSWSGRGPRRGVMDHAGRTSDEKLVLGQVAGQGLVHGKTKRTVRLLMARGLVRRQPHFTLMNETFRQFVLSPQLRDEVARLVPAIVKVAGMFGERRTAG